MNNKMINSSHVDKSLESDQMYNDFIDRKHDDGYGNGNEKIYTHEDIVSLDEIVVEENKMKKEEKLKLQKICGGVNQIRKKYDQVALSLLSDKTKEREIGLHPERKQDEINEAWSIRNEKTLTGNVSLTKEQEQIANKLKLSDELWQTHEYKELACDDKGSSSPHYQETDDLYEGHPQIKRENKEMRKNIFKKQMDYFREVDFIIRDIDKPTGFQQHVAREKMLKNNTKK